MRISSASGVDQEEWLRSNNMRILKHMFSFYSSMISSPTIASPNPVIRQVATSTYPHAQLACSSTNKQASSPSPSTFSAAPRMSRPFSSLSNPTSYTSSTPSADPSPPPTPHPLYKPQTATSPPPSTYSPLYKTRWAG